MAIWLEMRCEDRNEEDRQCWSKVNTGPMLLAGDTLADVRMGYSELRAQAARMKWKQTAKGWLCPFCAAAGVPEVVSPAMERQRRLVATLPQTREQVARLTPCAALGKGADPVHCGHCGKTVTPGACAYGVQEGVKLKPTDCIHCGKELCNDLGWCNSYKAAGKDGVQALHDDCPACEGSGISDDNADKFRDCDKCGGAGSVVLFGGGEQRPCPTCGVSVTQNPQGENHG